MLNLAWDSISSLYTNLENAEVEWWDEDGTVTEEYWNAAQKPISIALALAQQGIEILIKGKIAAVSPFLLLAGTPRDWPSGCDKKNTSFSEFRTIDAHELLRAHDTICSPKLSNEFKIQFEKLRKIRNVIFHGVSKSQRVTGVDVIKVILEAVNTLVGEKQWFVIRKEYLYNHPNSIAYSPDHVDYQLIIEGEKIIELLTNSELQRYIGFKKKQRSYICYMCSINSGDAGLQPNIAQLKPNLPNSTSLFCFVCNKEYEVLRKNCIDPDCKGNVIEAEDSICLSCYKEN